MEMLVEIHSHYQTQIEIAERVDWVYDFALPPLLLHALFEGDTTALRRWLEIRPTNAVTVLDTHDGIGVIDVGRDQNDRSRSGLLSQSDIDRLVEEIHVRSNGASRAATGDAADNLDLYQVNCTYYDALGGDDDRYLTARLVQMLVPGVPQVYYVGALAGGNDLRPAGHDQRRTRHQSPLLQRRRAGGRGRPSRGPEIADPVAVAAGKRRPVRRGVHPSRTQ